MSKGDKTPAPAAAPTKRPPAALWGEDSVAADATRVRYPRLWLASVVSTAVVALVPLIIMFVINYHQYQKAFTDEVKHPIRLATANMRRTLGFFLEEREAALSYIVHARSFEELIDQQELSRTFRNISSNYRGFVDIGVIDSHGIQRSYVGPYDLMGKNYQTQEWFKETMLKGKHITNVFMGYRNYPHFAIAVRNETETGEAYILRATLNAAIFDELKESTSESPRQDTFILDHEGVLQTYSRHYGQVLGKIPFAVPPPSNETRIIEHTDSSGEVTILGYAYIDGSPFICAVVEHQEARLASWFNLRNELFWFLGGSVVLIVIVILAGATYMVRRVREADNRRLALLHRIEYTAKMASIGRLAAGVAHEINNPLAIISEKAGLLKDLVTLTDDFPQHDRLIRHIDPILSSVERCARITRRLLRFAKHVDIHTEPIELEPLLREVLGFLEKESIYRSLSINLRVDPGVPVIQSDRGRLQQVFLNIINNSFAAVKDGGRIEIGVTAMSDHFVKVVLRDNGEGIPEQNLPHIFEPFFTTKEKYGTGLGLSVTYGIVTKLGGRITVDSRVGEWTEFSVVLPVQHEAGASDGEE